MGLLASGAIVGGCRIEGVVGKGGMGVVYLARQLELERDVALKVISNELTEDSLARSRFLAEARAAAAVEHPNVVPVHAVGTDEDRAYLVMRFIRGDDLRTLVRRDGPLPPHRAATIAERLGDALDAIHRAGYVHRDVKPPNVLIDDDDHIYLSDFGLAKAALATRGPTSEDHWVGTLDYVAPEQIRGEPVDARTDVYALGGVLYYMLTGRPPFAHDADEAKLWAHLHEEAPRPSEHAPVPPGFDTVVVRALAKDKADRQASTGELGRAALAAARGEDVAALTVTARRPPGRSRLRRRTPIPWAWIAGLVFAAAGGALFALAVAGDDDSPPTEARATPTPPEDATPTGERSDDPSGRQGLPFSVGETFANVGNHADDIALTDDGVWVASRSRTKLVWMDPATGDRRRTDPIGGGAVGLDTDGSTVYVALDLQGAVARIDARTGRLLGKFPVSGEPRRVAVAPTGVWVAVDSTADGSARVERFTSTGERLESHLIADGVSDIEYGGGALWIALERRRRIVRAESGVLDNHAWLATPANDIVYRRGRLWATVGGDDVARIDPETEDAPAIPLPSRAGQIEVWGRYLAVTLQTSDELLILDRLDWRPAGRRWRLSVPLNPYAIEARGDRMWVTGLARKKLARIDR